MLALAFAGHAAFAQSFPQGVASGDATDTAAICWTRVAQTGSVRIDVALDDQFQQIVASENLEASEEADLALHFDATGLIPASRYFFRFVALATGEVSPIGTFKTAPQDRSSFRFIYTGDSNAADGPFQILGHLAAEAPDLWFWAGDTAYCDQSAHGLPPASDLAGYRAKHRQISDDPFLQSLLAASPVWVQWDDHEVANDYDGGDLEPTITPQQKADGYRAFFEYMPIRKLGVPDDPDRIYRSFRYGDLAEFFVLDCRQYRSRDVSRDGGGIDPRAFFLPTLEIETIIKLSDPSRTMLGKPQLDWLKTGLKNSTATWKFVLSSVPFTSLLVMPYDRWDGYDAERYDLLHYIDVNAIPGIVLLSADIHGNVYNPDVTYFLRNSLHESFSPFFSVPEFIAGPIGTDTIRQEIAQIGASVLDTPSGEFDDSLLFNLGFDYLAQNIRSKNRLAFLEPNRFAYLIVDVAPDRLNLTFRGIAADSTAVDPPLETLDEETLSASAPAPCFPAPFFPFFLCLSVVSLVRAARRRKPLRRRLQPVDDSAPI
jgi:alkaline phosphatase D